MRKILIYSIITVQVLMYAFILYCGAYLIALLG
jgi:hypothetical protein